MNKLIARVTAIAGMVAICASAALAKPKMAHHGKMMHHVKAKHTAVKAGYCPVCHMKLSTHANQYRSVAVKMGKKSPVMYCCSKCKMPASVLVKKKMMHGKMMHGKMMHGKMMHGKKK